MSALTTIDDVGGRFIVSAKKYWWAYTIAYAWNLSPVEVKKWGGDDIMEALAAIGLAK